MTLPSVSASRLIMRPATSTDHVHSNGQREDVEVSVVIVNWNGGEMLHDCLRSLAQCERLGRMEIIVVDNASTDGSWDSIPELPYPLRVVRNETNLGFAMACNQGAELGSGQFVLLLNPDSMLLPDSISGALDFLAQRGQSNVGICGIQLEKAAGKVSKTCSRLPTPRVLAAKSWRLDRFLPVIFPPVFMNEWNHQSTRDVEVVIGAFFLVRRGVWDQLGGMDERFFVYYEEVDFCERSRQAGYRTVYYSGVKARHIGGGSSKQIRGKAGFYNLRARLQYASKHFSPFGAKLVTLHTLTVEPAIRLLEAALKLKFQRLPEIFTSYSLLWRDWWAHGIRTEAIHQRPQIIETSNDELRHAA
jgi:hypothetical protein